MARDDLTTTIAAGAEADRLIEAYLAELGRAGRLTPDMADEVADGLCETVEGYRRLGLAPAEAVRAAVAEFGCADTVATAFRAETSRAASHRLGRRLMVSGPLVGVLWLSALLASAAPPLHRQLPGLWALLPLVGVAVVVGAPAAAIAVAASRPWRRVGQPGPLAAPARARARAAPPPGARPLLAIIAAHVLLHGHVVWPLVLLASTASGVRAILAGRVVARAVTTPSSR